MRAFLVLTLLVAALPAQSPVYFVLLKGASAVGYFSSEGKLLAQIPVGQHPHEAVFSSDGRLAYTADNGTMRIEHAGKGGNSLSIIDVHSRRKIGDISLGEFYRPHGIDFDPKTNRLVVSTELPDRLLLVDPVKKTVLRKYDTKGKTPHMVTLGPDGKWAYVSHAGGDTVAAVNLDSSDVKLMQVGTRPEGSVLSRDGKELYVTVRDAASISVIDTAKQQPIAHIPTCKGPVRAALSPDGATLVYACMLEKRVGFADPRKREQTGYVILPNTPVSCSLSQDGKLAFASAEEADTIYVISVADRKIVREIKTAKGAGPDPVFEIRSK